MTSSDGASAPDTPTPSPADRPQVAEASPRTRGWLWTGWDLIVATVRVCLRYRVTGLAAEAGFFALLSLPPLVLGLAASAGWIGSRLGRTVREDIDAGIQNVLEPFLTDDVVANIILPTLNEAFSGPRFDLISIGFLLSLWSGSRALNVYIDTISIMYGLGGHRGIVRTRALSLSLYVLTMVLSAVTLPLIVIGPSWLEAVLPEQLSMMIDFYWPAITTLAIVMLASLYHIATPVRSSWAREFPGALLAFVLWLVASWVMRGVVSASIGGSSIYGPLTTPIIVLLWLYLIAISVLIGAAVNAALDLLWPSEARAQARDNNNGKGSQGTRPPGSSGGGSARVIDLPADDDREVDLRDDSAPVRRRSGSHPAVLDQRFETQLDLRTQLPPGLARMRLFLPASRNPLL